MRATVNIEFGSEEIESFATSVIVKSVAGSLGEIAGNPESLQVLLAGLQQGIGMMLSHATASMHQHESPRARPADYGPFGPPPGHGYGYGPPPGANGPGGPGNVRPISEPATVEHCFAIDETRQTESGIGCCKCATYNSIQRTKCRHCGHDLCHVFIVTPPPVPPL